MRLSHAATARTPSFTSDSGHVVAWPRNQDAPTQLRRGCQKTWDDRHNLEGGDFPRFNSTAAGSSVHRLPSAENLQSQSRLNSSRSPIMCSFSPNHRSEVCRGAVILDFHCLHYHHKIMSRLTCESVVQDAFVLLHRIRPCSITDHHALHPNQLCKELATLLFVQVPYKHMHFHLPSSISPIAAFSQS